MRRTTAMALGLAGVIMLLALVLAVPAMARRGDLTGRNPSPAGQVTDQASAAARSWLDDNGYADLTIAEVVDINGRLYVVVADTEGNGAFELLASRDGTWVHPAPTMMWNTSYDLMTAMMAGMPHDTMMGSGMMSGDQQSGQHGSMNGGMMGGQEMSGMMNPAACLSMMGMTTTTPLAEPLTTDGATNAAQSWLDDNQPGAVAADPVAFPGYVTLRATTNTMTTGLIAVQLTTGAVWPLQWPTSQ